MKKFLIVFSLVAALQSCESSDDNNRTVDNDDPSVMQPPSEAIPDSTRLVNDSVIMPDTPPGNGHQVGNSDSIQRAKH